MELNVQERLALQNVLPQQGNFVTLGLVSELRAMLNMSEEEIDKFKVVVKDQQVTWAPEAVVETKEIPIGKTMKGVIVDALKKLDAAGQLTIAHLTLYEKFVQPGQ